MPAGVPKYVTINVGQLAAFKEGEVVSLHSAQEKGLFKASGYDARLPLKVETPLYHPPRLTKPRECRRFSHTVQCNARDCYSLEAPSSVQQHVFARG